MNILKFNDNYARILEEDGDKGHVDIIRTIVQLGHSSTDTRTKLYAATSLAHISEILECHVVVASDDVIDFMIEMLKDTKGQMSIDHHMQGCRFFANLSFQKDLESCRDQLIKRDISTFLLKAIDGCND